MLVAIEGIDGSGKTTQVRALAARLKSEGYCAVSAESAPQAVRDAASGSDDPLLELLSFARLVRKGFLDTVVPLAEKHDIVAVDRYALSLIVYQGYGLGLDLELTRKLAFSLVEQRIPDLLILLDLPPELASARLAHPDSLESRGREFFSRLRMGYLGEFASWGRRAEIVDASGDCHEVEAAVASIVSPLVAAKSGSQGGP